MSKPVHYFDLKCGAKSYYSIETTQDRDKVTCKVCIAKYELDVNNIPYPSELRGGRKSVKSKFLEDYLAKEEKVEQLEQQLADYEKALKFYADMGSWHLGEDGLTMCIRRSDLETFNGESIGGKTAREYFNKYKELKDE